MNNDNIAAAIITLSGLVSLVLTMRWALLREEQNLDDEDQP